MINNLYSASWARHHYESKADGGDGILKLSNFKFRDAKKSCILKKPVNFGKLKQWHRLERSFSFPTVAMPRTLICRTINISHFLQIMPLVLGFNNMEGIHPRCSLDVCAQRNQQNCQHVEKRRKSSFPLAFTDYAKA